MAIRIEHVLPASPAAVWAVIGDPGRVDWVPGVESCDYDGSVRRFGMPGAGQLAERILDLDPERRRLEYAVIESKPALEAHHASLQVDDHPDGALLVWETQVQPEAVEPFIRKNMDAALIQLEAVLAAG